jgi:hypothetical protein
MSKLNLIAIILIFSFAVFAQSEIMTNSQIVEMSKAALSQEIILNKIAKSGARFDVSTNALIELKKAGVSDAVISAMLDKAETSKNYSVDSDAKNYSENQPTSEQSSLPGKTQSPKEALKSAKTIAFQKSSLQPSRQALEKELLKRADWQKLNLTIDRYKDKADLFVEIGFVSGSWVTHRYVFRIYDRRSGAVLAAGETTSWGSLAENLARHISKKINEVIGN